MSRLLDNLLFFGRLLRRAGIDVHPGRMIDVVEALGHVNLAARDEVYYTCRALLVHGPEQLAIFDLAFDAFWRQQLARRSSTNPELPRAPEHSTERDESQTAQEIVAQIGAASESDDDAALSENAVRTWSEHGGLANKDFAALSAAELAEARSALARLLWNPG